MLPNGKQHGITKEDCLHLWLGFGYSDFHRQSGADGAGLEPRLWDAATVISSREQRAPFAGGAAGLSSVNFATVLLEVKSSWQGFHSLCYKIPAAEELMVPLCCRLPACPQQQASATWCHHKPAPGPSPIPKWGTSLIHDLAGKPKLCPVRLTLYFTFGGERKSWTASR